MAVISLSEGKKMGKVSFWEGNFQIGCLWLKTMYSSRRMALVNIDKAIIPAAGFGTRFLPQAKATPKGMLPLVDIPLIQVIVEELAGAGVKDIIIVGDRYKRAIEDHFDRHPELEALLEKNGKTEALAEVIRVSELANFVYVRQKGPMGNATPIFNAFDLVKDGPFFVFWSDDFFVGTPSRAQQMKTMYEKYGSTILAGFRTTKPEDEKAFAFVKGEVVEDGVVEVKEIVEKPGVGMAPSDLCIISGLYTPEIGPFLEKVVNGVTGREPNYTDAISLMLKDGKKVYAMEIKNAKYYNAGDKLGYLKAVVDFGLSHKEIAGGFKDYLKGLNLEA